MAQPVNIAVLIAQERERLKSSENLKGANKDAKIYVKRSTIVQQTFVYAHTIYIYQVAGTIFLASSSDNKTQPLCFVQVLRPKKRTKV